MEFVKRLLVKVDCPSIEESDTKRLSPGIGRVDIFIGGKFRMQNRESSLVLFFIKCNIFKCTWEMERLQK